MAVLPLDLFDWTKAGQRRARHHSIDVAVTLHIDPAVARGIHQSASTAMRAGGCRGAAPGGFLGGGRRTAGDRGEDNFFCLTSGWAACGEEILCVICSCVAGGTCTADRGGGDLFCSIFCWAACGDAMLCVICSCAVASCSTSCRKTDRSRAM